MVLKEGTDTSQGKPQIVSNINACNAIAECVRTTLGPRGMDKLIVDSKSEYFLKNFEIPIATPHFPFIKFLNLNVDF